MKKSIYVYALFISSLFCAQETNARDPFNLEPREVDQEEDNQKANDAHAGNNTNENHAFSEDNGDHE